MRKVVYNSCYGGFSLSLEGMKYYLELKGYTPKLHTSELSWATHYYAKEPWDFYDRDIDRHDPHLVKTVEDLGPKSFGDCAKLSVTEVAGPYRIDEYDGYESVKEPDGYDWIY